MKSLLFRPVASELAARRFGWGAGFVLLSACTALVLVRLAEIDPLSGIGLLMSAAAGWVVLGRQLPRAIRL